jgi:ABC-2 type transport system permease protein
MAVHKRAYRPYDGPLTEERRRFLVLPRYSFMELFESRVLLAYFVLCFVPFLVELAILYVANSAPARALLGIDRPPDAVRAEFFVATLTIQSTLAFLLAAWVAPVLVSPDLVNGALPLYLSRPFSRADYIAGKALVLVGLLSAITWAPGLVLFGVQAGLSGRQWAWDNLRVPGAILLGSAIWIAVLTLLGLAISACIKWRLVASAGLIATFFMGSAFGEMWREVLRNPWGRLANLTYLVGIVWRDLFDLTRYRAAPIQPLDDASLASADIPTWAAWAMLLATCAFCTWLLNRRLRAREVVA